MKKNNQPLCRHAGEGVALTGGVISLSLTLMFFPDLMWILSRGAGAASGRRPGLLAGESPAADSLTPPLLPHWFCSSTTLFSLIEGERGL